MVPIEQTWRRKRHGMIWRVGIGRNPFAGFWCGYVALPKTVRDAEGWGYVKPPGGDDRTAPEEITMNDVIPGIGRVIGFDLGHAWDIGHQPTEKGMRRRANRFADWVARYYAVELLWAAQLLAENEVRKFVETRPGDKEDDGNEERRKK